TTTSVGQTDPELGVNYTSIVGMEQIESTLNTGKDAYGFNLITDNFGEGSVKLNYVKLNDKQGQETTITGSWHKGTASAMTVTGDTDITVDANAYNIYMSGFSGYGFTNPTIDVTVSYDSTASGYKEATLYYVDNYNTDQEVWTGVEPENARYKEVQAGKQVTYSFSIDGTRHSLFACFDECTVSEIKVYDKTPDPIDITGNWTKGTESTMASSDPDVWTYAGAENIYVFNFSLEGYRSPTVEVTANYSSIPADGSYMQAELYSDGAKIGGSFVPVTETGTKTFTFDVSDTLTKFNVCFDGCAVTKVKIYDNRSPIPAEVGGKTADELAGMMGKAWNLGNALDSTSNGTAGETLWNNKFPVSKEMFDAVKDAGFGTVRIPVSYMDKIVQNADGTYTIDSAYMARVKQVVDAAISANLFVIVNIHNDGGNGVKDMWIDITKTGDEFTAVQNKFAGVWSSIANTFADYDQKLIFEGFNELNNGTQNEPSASNLSNVNELNRAFVTAVRNSGGENKKNQDRVLILNGYNADIDNTVNGFAKPDDKTASNVIIENRLMLSVHYYDPYDFALNENGTSEWDADTEYMEGQLQKIVTFANGLNMPVVIGEYGAIDKNNIDSREEYIVSFNAIATELGIVTAYWDNGNSGQYGFAIFDRTNNNVTTAGQVLLSSIIG
ncbi:glycoside hydrolase family 5 protein, partial [Hominimerdicola sp. 21CYCFAH17_S]